MYYQKKFYLYGCLLVLYKLTVRRHLEHANSVWCPHKLLDIKETEKVQIRVTKLVINALKMSHTDKLQHLKLPTVKYRGRIHDTGVI